MKADLKTHELLYLRDLVVAERNHYQERHYELAKVNSNIGMCNDVRGHICALNELVIKLEAIIFKKEKDDEQKRNE